MLIGIYWYDAIRSIRILSYLCNSTDFILGWRPVSKNGPGCRDLVFIILCSRFTATPCFYLICINCLWCLRRHRVSSIPPNYDDGGGINIMIPRSHHLRCNIDHGFIPELILYLWAQLSLARFKDMLIISLSCSTIYCKYTYLSYLFIRSQRDVF